MGNKQGCQMAYLQTQNPNLGKILEGLIKKNVGIFLMSFGIFTYGH
jgi:uncharacterized membrane protein